MARRWGRTPDAAGVGRGRPARVPTPGHPRLPRGYPASTAGRAPTRSVGSAGKGPAGLTKDATFTGPSASPQHSWPRQFRLRALEHRVPSTSSTSTSLSITQRIACSNTPSSVARGEISAMATTSWPAARRARTTAKSQLSSARNRTGQRFVRLRLRPLPVDPSRVKRLRIEFPADPREHGPMFLCISPGPVSSPRSGCPGIEGNESPRASADEPGRRGSPPP